MMCISIAYADHFGLSHSNSICTCLQISCSDLYWSDQVAIGIQYLHTETAHNTHGGCTSGPSGTIASWLGIMPGTIIMTGVTSTNRRMARHISQLISAQICMVAISMVRCMHRATCTILVAVSLSMSVWYMFTSCFHLQGATHASYILA